VHPKDAEALAQIRERGAIVTICTGRMYSGTRAIAREIGVDGPLACVDGGHIVDGRTDRSLCLHSLEIQDLERLRAVLASHSLASFVFSADTILHDQRGAPYLAYLSTWSERMQCLSDLLDPSVIRQLPEVVAVVAVGERTSIEAALAAVVASPGQLQLTSFALRQPELTGSHALIARLSGIDKGTATRFLARYHGVELEDVVVVGDWVNDLPMFKVAGRSFAMAHAPPDVKRLASDQLRANVWSGGGLREAARRTGLL